MNRITTQNAEVNLLNEEGTNLLNLKKTLMENKNNPLIFEALISGLKKLKVPSVLTSALKDEAVTVQTFASLLLADEKYRNSEIVEQLQENFKKKIANLIELKGYKFFLPEFDNRGFSIIRRFGFSQNFAMRTFRLSPEEANLLMQRGQFMEQYANLKLNAVFKDMVKKVQNKFKDYTDLNFEVSQVYHNSKENMYDLDFRILVPIDEFALKEPNTLSLSAYARKISEILFFVDSEYHQAIRQD